MNLIKIIGSLIFWFIIYPMVALLLIIGLIIYLIFFDLRDLDSINFEHGKRME